MKKRIAEPILWTLVFVVVSFLLYAGYYMVVLDMQETFLTWLGNLAFIPFELLLVTLIIEQLLRSRERRTLRRKLNMIIGAFFSEVGVYLMKYISEFDIKADQNRAFFDIDPDWTEREFSRALKRLENVNYEIDAKLGDLQRLDAFLESKRTFLLRLLENPSLLEDGPLSDLLWSVFLIAEELDYRQDMSALPETDYAHLAEDLRRAYFLLLREWMVYLRHLKESYPFLFSLALRMDPFDPQASAVVTV